MKPGKRTPVSLNRLSKAAERLGSALGSAVLAIEAKVLRWCVFVVLWLLGAFAFHVGGGLIHLVLVVAVIVVIVQLLQGRRV